ncbi:MAG: hypothetical protein EBU90_23600 [Proteobacteria bacterium]|nr:hypothetical protein [Pseudomonadota bacterium]NBP16086.1 hypothetical protein [bacterium]
MFFIFFGLLIIILIAGSYHLLFKWNRKEDITENSYLFAKKIFVRDPEVFKDKDKDGIDDIIDNNIK